MTKIKTPTKLRKECVTIAKKIVKIRDKGICQKCGKKGDALHCSHVYPEGTYHGMSANPLNMKLLCFYCHFYWWHKDVIEARNWFKANFPERFKILNKLSKKVIKMDWGKEKERLKKELQKVTH